MSTIVGFFHGQEGNPEGSKGKWLSERYQLLAPWYQTRTLSEAVQQTRAWFEPWLSGPAHNRPQVLIGSSFGGAVLHEFVRQGWWEGPVVYLAPAFMLQTELGHPFDAWVSTPRQRTVIVHGIPDDVVPLDHSLQFARKCSDTLLIAGPWSHRLGEILVDGTLEYAIAQALTPVFTLVQSDNA